MEKQLELMKSVGPAEAANGAGPLAPVVPINGRRSMKLPHLTSGEEGMGPNGEGADAPAAATAPAAPVAVEPGGRGTPLTDVQRDVWINCQLGAGGSAAYDLTATLRLSGSLDIDALSEAVRRLVQRHGSLRTTFDANGDHQVIHPSLEVPLRVVDMSDGPEVERTKRIDAFLDAELSVAYDLVKGPLFRSTLLRLGPDEHTLVLSGHHLVCDGWSFGVMQRDLGAIYSAMVRGESPDLADAPRHADYVTWRAAQSDGSEPYWLELHREPPTELDLPADRQRQPVRTFACGSERAVVETELLADLRDLATAEGVTTFVVLLAAWEMLLHRLSGQGEFASGVFVSGQAFMGADDLVGLCANLLPLRARAVAGESVADYLRRLKSSTFDALDNQCHSVGALATALNVPRDASRPALVSTAITLETPTGDIVFEGLEAVQTNHGRRTFGSYDLEAYLTESAEDLIVDFQYSSDLFDSDTIRRWLGHYVHLLRQMTVAASAPVAELGLLDASERQEILTRGNETEAPVPDRSIRERIEQQAALHPDRPAIRTSDRSMTYGELNASSNRLARHLRDIGVGPERPVGVHLNRSPEMVVALLAVHKARGAYVPLDPMFPIERLTTITQDAGLHALITEAALADSIRADGAAMVVLEDDASVIEGLDDTNLGIASAPEDLAYVISTSGSTGKPKGVEITQHSLTNQLTSMLHQPGLQADDVLLAVTTMSFDPSLMEICLPLMVGATIVLADASQAGDAVWLRERLAASDITVMQATPATWQMLLDAGWSGTPGLKAICGGEALTQDLAAAVGSRVDSLWNVYGTTEATIWQSSSRVSQEGGLIPIGAPIANTEFHVLDERREPQPPGVVGELYVGGVGLARGYRDQPELTDERFIFHRFDDEPPRRLYRTGDLARRLPGGDIEFLGRNDFQVKIRGYRIELGEIETVLAGHPGVRECTVVARAGADGTKRLVAYVVPATGNLESVSELRVFLRNVLPEYMVPSVFVPLDELPLSPNRKVDRSRLPDPDGHRPDLATELVKPRNETEAALAAIWERLLDVEEVGVEDNFFDLGGDSLTALRSMMEANRAGMSLAASSIFQYQTVAALATRRGEGGLIRRGRARCRDRLHALDTGTAPVPHGARHARRSSLGPLHARAGRTPVAERTPDRGRGDPGTPRFAASAAVAGGWSMASGDRRTVHRCALRVPRPVAGVARGQGR